MAGRRRIIDDSDSDSEEVMIVDNVDDNNVGKDKAKTRDAPPQQQQNTKQQQAIHPKLQQKIYTEAGLQPSNYWLEKCLSHLRTVGNDSILGSSNLEEESLWTQILHADLRDVVRDPYGNSSSDRGDESAAVQLRNAISQSKTNASNNSANAQQHNSYNSSPDSMQQHVSSKVTLPSSFHLLVQMEEVCDVTMNSEQQLAAMGGGSSSGAPQNNNSGRQPYNNQGGQRNQKYRMLKMVFSDGYYPNGKPYPPPTSSTSQQNQILLSMETSPIKNLSVSSPPGLKLLLHGPIDVTFGILQLNNGNCTVIGGYIDSWKEIWIQAREKAQKSRGLGVDPTIKALIGTEGLLEEEEEVDEGEGESGDVTAPPQPPPPQQMNHQPVLAEDDGLGPFQPWNNNMRGNTYQQPQHGRNNMTPPNQNTAAAQQQSNINMSNNPATLQNTHNQGQSSSTMNVASSSRNNNAGNLRQQTLDSYPKKPRPETTRLLPSNNNGASRPAVQQQIGGGGGNPYQRANNNNNGGRNAQPNNNNLAPMFQQRPQQQPQRQQQQQQPPPPPVAAAVQNNSNVIPIDDDSPPKRGRGVQSNPYASLRPPPASNSNASLQQQASSSTSFNSNPSFSELRTLLQSLRTNRALYDQYYGKVITVPCKISDSGEQGDKDFNIVKANSYGSPQKTKKKNKKDKKYQFLLVGKFFGPKKSEGEVACRVASSVIEPYFGKHTAGEIRKISREDKDRANRLVNQSSTALLHDLSSLSQYQMKLMLTADEFYAKLAQVPRDSTSWMVDIGNPFLLVLKKV